MARDGLDADGGGQVRLAGARAADEHDVLRRFGEAPWPAGDQRARRRGWRRSRSRPGPGAPGSGPPSSGRPSTAPRARRPRPQQCSISQRGRPVRVAALRPTSRARRRPCRAASAPSAAVTITGHGGLLRRSRRAGCRSAAHRPAAPRAAQCRCSTGVAAARLRLQPRQHVEHVFGAERAALQHQLDRHQHRLQPCPARRPAPAPSPGRRRAVAAGAAAVSAAARASRRTAHRCAARRACAAPARCSAASRRRVWSRSKQRSCRATTLPSATNTTRSGTARRLTTAPPSQGTL